MKLRLSRPSETPSEEEEEEEEGEGEVEDDDDDDDVDTSHYHRYVFRCQRKKGGPKLFQDEGHKGERLSRWACKYIKALRWGYPSQRQVTALDRFENGSVRQYLRDDQCFSQEAFAAFFEVFDDLFFFGSLRERVTFRIVPLTGNQQSTIPALTKPVRVIVTDGTTEMHIEIQITTINEVNELLGILLHEMCHAFFLIYSCNVDNCMNRFENCAKDGHGIAWQKVAAAIEKYARQKLSLQLDLTRLRSFAMAIVIADESFETWQVHDMGRGLGLDPDDLEQCIAEDRDLFHALHEPYGPMYDLEQCIVEYGDIPQVPNESQPL
jgi:hypothetical protein